MYMYYIQSINTFFLVYTPLIYVILKLNFKFNIKYILWDFRFQFQLDIHSS
jgi:hypothetical protein